MVDLKSDMLEGARFASRFKPEFLANLACHYTFQNRRVDAKESKPKKEAFQSVIKVEMFGMRLIIVNNWYIGVIAMCSLTGDLPA